MQNGRSNGLSQKLIHTSKFCQTFRKKKIPLKKTTKRFIVGGVLRFFFIFMLINNFPTPSLILFYHLKMQQQDSIFSILFGTKRDNCNFFVHEYKSNTLNFIRNTVTNFNENDAFNIHVCSRNKDKRKIANFGVDLIKHIKIPFAYVCRINVELPIDMISQYITTLDIAASNELSINTINECISKYKKMKSLYLEIHQSIKSNEPMFNSLCEIIKAGSLEIFSFIINDITKYTSPKIAQFNLLDLGKQRVPKLTQQLDDISLVVPEESTISKLDLNLYSHDKKKTIEVELDSSKISSVSINSISHVGLAIKKTISNLKVSLPFSIKMLNGDIQHFGLDVLSNIITGISIIHMQCIFDFIEEHIEYVIHIGKIHTNPKINTEALGAICSTTKKNMLTFWTKDEMDRFSIATLFASCNVILDATLKINVKPTSDNCMICNIIAD